MHRMPSCKRVGRLAAAAGVLVCVLGPGPLGALGGEGAGGQDAATQPAQEETWLRVAADEVNIRSRPDANSLPVACVPRGTLLRAVGRDPYGWHRIRPPEGVFSFVAAEYVDRRSESEGIVSVRSGTLRVRVGSLVRDVNPAETEVQALLERGEVLRIVGEQGAWLKIVPPPGVSVYVAAQHVEAITDDVAARLQVPAVPSSPPATQTAPPAAADEPDLSGTWGRRLAAVEAAVAAESRKPLAEQSWTEAVAQLEPIAVQREEPAIARLAAAWIAQLEQRAAEQQAVRAADEILERAARERAQRSREQDRIERARRAATQPAFAARGQLQRSYALEPSGATRWYRLVDPLTGRMEAYLELGAEGRDEVERLVGQYVGVRGVRRWEAALGADAVRVDEIVALPPAGAATQPATRPIRQTP